MEKDVFEEVGLFLGCEDAEFLGDEVRKCELEMGMRGMKKGKTPGVDGLPVEFYNMFWEVIVDSVDEVCVEVLKGGRLPICMGGEFGGIVVQEGREDRFEELEADFVAKCGL